MPNLVSFSFLRFVRHDLLYKWWLSPHRQCAVVHGTHPEMCCITQLIFLNEKPQFQYMDTCLFFPKINIYLFFICRRHLGSTQGEGHLQAASTTNGSCCSSKRQIWSEQKFTNTEKPNTNHWKCQQKQQLKASERVEARGPRKCKKNRCAFRWVPEKRFRRQIE